MARSSTSRIHPAIATGIGAVLSAIAFAIMQSAGPSHVATDAPRHTAEPAAPPPKPAMPEPDDEPTTDKGVIAARILRSNFNDEIRRLEADIATERTQRCNTDEQLRLSEAERVKLAAELRRKNCGEMSKQAFLEATDDWPCASKRRSLHEFADAAIAKCIQQR
jgi:hypothetical protein